VSRAEEIAARDVRAEVVRLMREDFDPTPPGWEGREWNDNAEDVADKIIAAITAERDRLLGEVERLTREREQDAIYLKARDATADARGYARGVEDAARAAGHAEIDAPNIAETYDRLMAEHAEKLRDAVVAAIRALAPGGAT
jgi:hypothetical protein